MNQPNTGRFTYPVTNLTTSQPQFIFPATSTLYLPMGFNRASTNIFSSSILPSSTKAVLQEIYTTANPDFSLITFSQNDVELNLKELLYKDNNVSFSITDEDDNMLNFNGQDLIFTICCYEYNYSLEILKNDILIKNIQKLMN